MVSVALLPTGCLFSNSFLSPPQWWLNPFLPLSVQWAVCQRTVNILRTAWALAAQTGWQCISWGQMTSACCLTYWRGSSSAAWPGPMMPRASFTTPTHVKMEKQMVRKRKCLNRNWEDRLIRIGSHDCMYRCVYSMGISDLEPLWDRTKLRYLCWDIWNYYRLKMRTRLHVIQTVTV